MTRIAITGALGRMGTLVIQEAARSPDMQIVAGWMPWEPEGCYRPALP